jgi:hypothetical protein
VPATVIPENVSVPPLVIVHAVPVNGCRCKCC